MARNVVAAEVGRRVASANVAVVLDSRPKVVRAGKGKGSYRRKAVGARSRDDARGEWRFLAEVAVGRGRMGRRPGRRGRGPYRRPRP